MNESKWPSDYTSAAAFTFDFDAESVWIGVNPVNAGKPGVLSQGTYGARVAVPLILALLRRHEVKATFFVPGIVAETYPKVLQAIVDDGHELGHHGFTHTSPTTLTAAEEEEELDKGLAALRSFGVEVVGYRSPSWNFSPATLGLLESRGFLYSSNLMDDIRPHPLPDSSLIEIPVHWSLDDAPHFWFDVDTWTKKISTLDEVRAVWEAEFNGIRTLGGSCVFTMHPQIIGRPGRIDLLDHFVQLAKARSDVWIATCAELAQRGW